MYLDAEPFHLEIEFLLKQFDKTLADIAERSDVIGKDSYGYAHNKLLSSGFIVLNSRGGGRSYNLPVF